MSRKHPSDVFEPGIDPCADLATLRRRMGCRARLLKDPRYGHVRHYPNFKIGMSTAQYIAQYELMNKSAWLSKVEYIHARGHNAPYNPKETEA